MGILIRSGINAAAIWVAASLLTGLAVIGGDGFLATLVVFLAVGLVFGLINSIIKPVVKLVSLPLYLLTLGLFALVVNALMLMLTGWISGFTQYGLRVDSFGTAVIGGLIIAIVSVILTAAIPAARDKD